VLLAAAPFLLFPDMVPLATAAALLLLCLAWLGRWWVSGQPLIVTPFNAAFLLWGLAVIVGMLVTADPDLTLSKATGIILGLATWRFLALYGGSRPRIGAALAVLGLLGAGFVLIGMFSTQWKVDSPILAPLLNVLPPRLFRFSATPDSGVSANQLAATLIVYLPLLVSLLVGWRPARYRRAAVIGLVLLTGFASVVLFLTQSRSGWLGALGGLAALLLFWAIALPPSRQRLTLWLALGLVVAIGAAVLLFVGPARLLELWDKPPEMTAVGTFSTLNFRKEVWQWAVQGVQDFPLTGCGLGAFRRVVHRFYPIAIPISYDLAHAHNIFLQVALDVGLPGLVGYLAILAVTGVLALRVARRHEAFRPLVLGLAAGLVALHTFGLTDALAVGSKPGIVFWFALGILTAVNQLSLVETGCALTSRE
jgi:putative inorganic carbon (HCO3(-)) transporter